MIVNKDTYQNIIQIPKTKQNNNIQSIVHTLDLYKLGLFYKSYHVSDIDCLVNYYIFNIDLTDVEKGEYEYCIDNFEKGLIQITDDSNENKDYDSELENIKQYE